MPAALAFALAALAATAATPPAPDTVVSRLDVPGRNHVVMTKPDRSGDKVICRNEQVPDSRLSKRNCVRRRDREAATAAHQQLLTNRQHACDIVGAC